MRGGKVCSNTVYPPSLSWKTLKCTIKCSSRIFVVAFVRPQKGPGAETFEHVGSVTTAFSVMPLQVLTDGKHQLWHHKLGCCHKHNMINSFNPCSAAAPVDFCPVWSQCWCYKLSCGWVKPLRVILNNKLNICCLIHLYIWHTGGIKATGAAFKKINNPSVFLSSFPFTSAASHLTRWKARLEKRLLH